MKNKFLLFLFIIIGVSLQSCKDDEAPSFTVANSNIDATNYSAGGSPTVVYSKDGSTFSTAFPRVKKGEKIYARVSNGTSNLSADNFSFDWSASSPAPASANSDIAEFTATTNISIKVTIADILTIITSNRTTGKVYAVDPSSGSTTELFTPTYNSSTLKSLRAFVYHPNKKLYYASVNSDEGGYLYTINPSTKEATMINENDGANGAAIWDAIVNWAVAKDDSLVSVGDFNEDGNGIVKFGTDGGRSTKTTQTDFCCGLGMLYNPETSVITLGNGSDTGNGEIELQDFSATGDVSNDILITDLQSFPVDESVNWLTLKSMTKGSDGTIYGIVYSDGTAASYFVKINTSAPSITYISTLGADKNNQYNALAIIPKYTYNN